MIIEERRAEFPNRRRIKKIKQEESGAIIADIERCPNLEGVKPGKEGTPVTAESLKRMVNEAISALPIGAIIPALSVTAPAGFVPLNGGTYNRASFPDFYDMCVQGKLGRTVTFVRYEDELRSQPLDNCGFIGLDTATQRFRVPRITQGMVISNTQLSDMGNASGSKERGSLPNVRGSFGTVIGTSMDGPFCTTRHFTWLDQGRNGAWYSAVMGEMSLGRRNPIYNDNTTTVVPQSVRYPYFICVANRIPTASQVVWDGFVGNLNTMKREMEWTLFAEVIRSSPTTCIGVHAVDMNNFDYKYVVSAHTNQRLTHAINIGVSIIPSGGRLSHIVLQSNPSLVGNNMVFSAELDFIRTRGNLNIGFLRGSTTTASFSDDITINRADSRVTNACVPDVHPAVNNVSFTTNNSNIRLLWQLTVYRRRRG